MVAKALDLFSAYRDGMLPSGGGYIVSSFMVDGSRYARYEIVAYRDARNLSQSAGGLTFASTGSKIFVLVEPADYAGRTTEPFQRDHGYQIPHSLAELTMVTAKDHCRVMVSTEPVIASSAFTIACPMGIDFVFVFFPRTRVLDTIQSFFSATLAQECHVPEAAAQRAARLIRARLARCSVGKRTW